MSALTRHTICAVILLTLSTFVVAAPLKDKPEHASLIIVPSPFDKFLIQTGDVKVSFHDGHSEMWTKTGDCRNVKISPKGNIGWVRMDKKNLDVERMTTKGKDTLVIRLLDGTQKKFELSGEFVGIEDWKFADNDAAVIIAIMAHHGPASYFKYDTYSGKLRDGCGGYTPYDELPSWAKPLANPNDR